MVAEARAFLDMGCSVLLVDFRGSGDSSESYTTVGYYEAEDVAAAVDYARKQLPHSKTILYGGSMGAAAVLRAVASCDVQPDAIIAEAIFDKMLNTVRHRFEAMGVPSFPSAQLLVFWGGRQAGFNGFAHNPVDTPPPSAAHSLSARVRRSPAHLEEARRVFAAVSAPKNSRNSPTLATNLPWFVSPQNGKPQSPNSCKKRPTNPSPEKSAAAPQSKTESNNTGTAMAVHSVMAGLPFLEIRISVIGSSFSQISVKPRIEDWNNDVSPAKSQLRYG